MPETPTSAVPTAIALKPPLKVSYILLALATSVGGIGLIVASGIGMAHFAVPIDLQVEALKILVGGWVAVNAPVLGLTVWGRIGVTAAKIALQKEYLSGNAPRLSDGGITPGELRDLVAEAMAEQGVTSQQLIQQVISVINARQYADAVATEEPPSEPPPPHATDSTFDLIGVDETEAGESESESETSEVGTPPAYRLSPEDIQEVALKVLALQKTRD